MVQTFYYIRVFSIDFDNVIPIRIMACHIFILSTNIVIVNDHKIVICFVLRPPSFSYL